MKRPSKDPMRPEYDFSKAERGKYLARLVKGANVVVLDSDVAAVYRDSKSVNSALRRLAGLERPRKRRGR